MLHQLSVIAVAAAIVILLGGKAVSAASCGCSADQWKTSPDNETVRIDDIVIPKEEFEQAVSPDFANAHSPSSYINCRSPWPNGILRYRFHSSYPSEYNFKESIRSSLASLQSIVNNFVTFVEADSFGNEAHVTITNGDGCWSYVGRRRSHASQDLSLSISHGCLAEGRIQRLFMYALGFGHEHSRSDRDKFVDIQWNNIRSDKCLTFYKTSYGIPGNFPGYDYNSIVHYNSYSQTCNNSLQTIVTKNGSGIPEQLKLSSLDVAKIQFVYSANNLAHCFGTTKGPPKASDQAQNHSKPSDGEQKSKNLYVLALGVSIPCIVIIIFVIGLVVYKCCC